MKYKNFINVFILHISLLFMFIFHRILNKIVHVPVTQLCVSDIFSFYQIYVPKCRKLVFIKIFFKMMDYLHIYFFWNIQDAFPSVIMLYCLWLFYIQNIFPFLLWMAIFCRQEAIYCYYKIKFNCSDWLY